MAGEWKAVPLNELYEFSSGLSKPSSAFGSGYPFLSFKDVFYNIFVPKELSEQVNSTDQERAKCSIKRGDVFLTRTSETMDELGMSCVALRDIPNATFNGFTKRLRPKTSELVVPEYAGYFFRGPAFRQAVTAMSSMSTRASLNNEMLARLSIVLPSIAEQEAIGHILGTLDDKIELNQHMNETLEAMAQSLFKSWFVNFGPVRAKAEYCDPGLPKPLADLLPDSFEDSELGEIPKGWRVVRLGDPDLFPLVTPGVLHKATAYVHYVATGDVQRDQISQAAQGVMESLPSRANMQPGEGRIWFAKMKDSPKYLWTMKEDQEYWSDRVLSTGFAGVEVTSSAYEALLYCFVASPDFERTKNNLATGTTMQALNNDTIRTISLVVPPPSIAAQFDNLVRPLFRKRWSNAFEVHTLTNLRDMLLPRLISGELRLDNVAPVALEA